MNTKNDIGFYLISFPCCSLIFIQFYISLRKFPLESVPFKNVSVDLLYQVINAKLTSSAAQVKITSYIERKLGSWFVIFYVA